MKKRNDNEIYRAKNCALSRCTKWHPKNCRTYTNNGFYNFKKDCAYSNTEILKERKDLVFLTEEMKNLRAELDILKNTMKTLGGIKQEVR